MPIHLFPKTQKSRTLETLANVPPGTHRRLQKLHKEHLHHSLAFHTALTHDPGAHRLYIFLAHGFGPLKVQPNLLKIHFLNPTEDSTEKQPLIREILSAQNLILPANLQIRDLGGINWKPLSPKISSIPQKSGLNPHLIIHFPHMTHQNPITITRTQLSKWHKHFRPKTLSSIVGISANEEWNKQQGLPNPFIRDVLHHVWYDKNGILGHDKVTPKDIEIWTQNQTTELKTIAQKHGVTLTESDSVSIILK